MTKSDIPSSHSLPPVNHAADTVTLSAARSAKAAARSTKTAVPAARSAKTAAWAEMDCRQWISGFSHEIRNPLTLIYSSLQLLEKEYPCVSASPLWAQTKGDIQHLLRLLKDSLAVTREYQPEFTVFPVQDLFRELLVSAQPLLKEHHIRLDIGPSDDASADSVPAVNAPTDGDASAIHTSTDNVHAGNVPDEDNTIVIRADRTRLKEALTNLLINAADALSSMPNSHQRRILLYTMSYDTGESPFLCLHVRDNGPGIPEEYLNTLFDPFVTHKSNGTGLGLSIVRTVAELHGGTVSVETGTEEGASFTDFCLCIPAVSMSGMSGQ